MKLDKSLLAGSTSTLLLKLLEEKDMYGYEMIQTLAARSDHRFDLKAGTLYPILHGLEKKGYVSAYEEHREGERVRKYYRLTPKGIVQLREKEEEWDRYTESVNRVLKGGVSYAEG